MLLKKKALFILAAGFFAFVSGGVNYAQEATGGVALPDTSSVDKNTDEAAKTIPANYQAAELVREFGIGEFGQSAQIAFSPDMRTIYVADPSSYEIKAFGVNGEMAFKFGGQIREFRGGVGATEDQIEERRKIFEAESEDRFKSIMEMNTDAKGNVYVADYGADAVKVFTSDGKFVLLVPMQKNLQKKDNTRGASGVAINSRGDIYITDSANARIQINDLNGKYKYQITKFKDRDGKELGMVNPGHPRINSSDELYVLDSLVCRVHRFNAKGNYLGSFGYMGDGAGGFNAPLGIAIDKLDRVYVADRGLGLVQVFSKDGNFLYALCDENGKKIAISLVNGISVDSDNLIYISMSDTKGYHVKVFKYLTKTTK